MFSQKEFIDASRDFVCVRLESYESEEHQKMVRSFLNGRFENTAFCLLAPDGVERLSGTGRSPAMGLRAGRRGGRGAGGNDLVVDAMKGIAGKYSTKGKSDEIVVQDFHTFKQSLNVASGDQRLLLYVVAPESEREGLRKSLRPVLGDRDVIGRFHTDFAGEESDADWRKVIDGATSKAGLFIIRSDKFGQKGSVMAGLPLDAESKEIKSALLSANAKFAKSETRKVYSEHVSAGRRQQVYFENAMPYGEDRDGDGEIDHKGRGRGGPGGAGRPQGGPRGRGGPPEGRRGGPGRGGPGRGGSPPGEREGPPKARPGGR